jgi:hypothetical protein
MMNSRNPLNIEPPLVESRRGRRIFASRVYLHIPTATIDPAAGGETKEN